MYMLILASMDL